MTSNGKLTALVGGQFGSEGKGAVVAYLASRYDFHIRTGAPNAGHTLSHEGRVWKMRSVPCGWVSPEATLVIGAGGLIDPALLREEVDALDKAGYDVSGRLLIDRNAGLLDARFHEMEGGVEGQAHKLIGSTGEGVGPARMARVARKTFPPPFDDFRLAKHATPGELPGRVVDSVPILNEALVGGASVLMEGTQGSGLSLIHGEWPFVTSSDTNAAALASDAGFAPQKVTNVILVCRTYPIRVAGNSGPLFEERSWADLDIPPETTTVTNKIRRVGEWDKELVKKACLLNDPSDIALTFLDYIFPEVSGMKNWSELPQAALNYLKEMEESIGHKITLVGTGPGKGGEFCICER
jgi:adenylosuccinate synthase